MRRPIDYDIRSALDRAGIRYKSSGNGWIRCRAVWRDSRENDLAINIESGGWKDHGGDGASGGLRNLCDRLGLDRPARREFTATEKAAWAKARREKRARDQADTSVRVGLATNAWNAALTTLDGQNPAQAWARTYLTSRGPGILEAAIAAGVRVLPDSHKSSWNPDAQKRAHCVLWPIRDPQSGDLVGVQREWGRGHKNKRMQGRHMVQVNPADPDTLHSAYLCFPGTRDTLYICEGQVSAAAVAAASGCRTVALFDTAGIAKPPRSLIQRAIRDGVTKIVMAGDAGAGGEKAALEGLRVIQTWGLQVPLVWTVPVGEDKPDWADILERHDAEAVRIALTDGVREIPAHDPQKKKDTVWSIQAWRPATEPVLPAATVPVEQARAIIKTGVQMMVQDYISWLQELDERREQGTKGGRLPTARPWLFKPTTGTGKTTAIKNLIGDAALLAAGGSVLALVPTHDQADAYEADSWWHYYGRSPDPTSPGYCPNHAMMMETVEAHHIPQAEFCHKCPNGLKWAGKTEDLMRMGFVGEKLAQLEACVWQQHLRDTMEQPFVVAPSASFSETLATWMPEGAGENRPARHRLVTVDEHCQMSIPIEGGLTDINLWARRLGDTLRFLENEQARADAVTKQTGPTPFQSVQESQDERRAEIAAAKAALDLFKVLAGELGRMVGHEGRISVEPALLDATKQILDVDQDDVTEWERLEFNRDGTLKLTPLRAAWAIRQTLEQGDGFVKDGKLHVAGVRPILDRVGRRPIAFFDATPDPVTVDAVRAHDGHIVTALATQHVRITRHPSRFWGLKPFSKNATPEQKKRAIRQYKALRRLHPHAVLLVHKKVRAVIDPDGEDESLGHWGSDHRAHDRWAGKDIVIVGSFFPPMGTWRAMYQAARIAALSAGADPSDWPEWPDSMEMEEGEWITEGTHQVQSFLPLPTDPKIRAWLLETITAEVVQAIGRCRGANLDPAHPVTIHTYGGVPLYGLGEHGLTVETYQADDPSLGASRSGKALDARQAIAAAADAGQRTIKAIQAWVKARFKIIVGIDRVRSVMRSLEAAARASGDDIEAIYQKVAQRADAYLHQAKGDIEIAISTATAARDWLAAELLDIPIQAEDWGPITTDPPPAA